MPLSRSPRLVSRCFAALMLGISLACPAALAWAAEPAPALAIVFDGSGSMWGRLGPGPQSKFVAAREALIQALPDTADQRTGLVTFGRRRGDCTDVEVVAPVETGDRQRLVGALEKLNPRGRGPIALALRTAAKALDAQPGARHVLILHDEPDNCSVDTCAAAAELKAADPRLVVSTVSLGATAEDVRAVACLAARTGGKAFSAETPQDAMAAITAAVKFALPTGAARDREPAPGARKNVPAGDLAQGPSRARLTARLGAAGPELARGLSWRIWRSGTDEATVAETQAAVPEVRLDPGRYRVEVRTGLATATREIEVKPSGVTPVDVAIDAGRLRTSVALKRGQPVLPSGRITLRADNTAASAAVEPALWIGAPGELIVPPGSYVVVAGDGRVRTQQRLTVTAGLTSTVELWLDAGRVTLAAVARDGGGALDDMLFRVLEADPDAIGGFREIARTAAPSADLVLPAGTYVIVAAQGGAEVRERVTIVAGEDARYTFRLAVGHVAVSARLPNGTRPPADGVRFRVSAVDAPLLEPIETSADDPTFSLPPGRYRVEVRIGTVNAIGVREFEVKSGADQTVAVVIAAGEVQLRAADAIGGLALADPFWEIVDGQNRVVWRTVQSRPRAFLAEGRYTVRLAGKARRLEKSIDVRSGAPVSLTLGED